VALSTSSGSGRLATVQRLCQILDRGLRRRVLDQRLPGQIPAVSVWNRGSLIRVKNQAKQSADRLAIQPERSDLFSSAFLADTTSPGHSSIPSSLVGLDGSVFNETGPSALGGPLERRFT
jgi:hypothetical protein